MNIEDEEPVDERIASALESIAVSFAVIAEAMMRDDEGTTTGPPRNPLRTMDQPDEPSGN